MTPPVKPILMKNKTSRIKRKPRLSDIKEEDEEHIEPIQEFSTIYRKPEETIATRKVSSEIKKSSKSKLATTKHKQSKNTSKSSTAKNDYLQDEKPESHAKIKRNTSTNKTKLKKNASGEKPSVQLVLSKKETPLQGSLEIFNRHSYIPVIRSFADPDVTSLPIDDIFGKRPYLMKNDSKLPKPIKATRTKKTKKSSRDKNNSTTNKTHKHVSSADANIDSKKVNKMIKVGSNEKKTSNSKKIKVSTVKTNSKLPRRINKSKRKVEGKTVTKIPVLI